MDAKQAGAGTGPPKSKNEKGALAGAHLHGATNTLQQLTSSAETVKQEADRHFLVWLRTGIDYHRRLARAASDAARKQTGGAL
jgi:hypothetical protein